MGLFVTEFLALFCYEGFSNFFVYIFLFIIKKDEIEGERVDDFDTIFNIFCVLTHVLQIHVHVTKVNVLKAKKF